MTPPSLSLDHLVIAASRLGEGIDFVEEKLGVRVPLGGKHPVMNTHNAVGRLGDGAYLEIIAVDPEAGPAGHARWFGLDDARMRSRLASEGPMIVTWVARSPDLPATLAASLIDLGEPLELSRGSLSWQITVRRNGSMPLGGLAPSIIAWPPGPHPSARMADLSLRFSGLTLRAEKPPLMRNVLTAMGAGALADIKPKRRGAPAMEATFVRADGSTVTICGDESGPAN